MDERRGKLPMIIEEFVVEHLASFPQDTNCGYTTPTESLDKLKRISSDGGLWAQKMNMRVSVQKLVMANGETMEVIEEYPMEQVNLCITILDDDMFENLLIFATRPSHEKVGAVHLFHCKPGETDLISGVINYQMENRMFQQNNDYMNNGDSQDMLKSRSDSSSQVSSDSSDSMNLPTETRTHYNLQQKHKVAQVVQAFQEGLDKPRVTSQPIPGVSGHVITKLQDAKITRDVEILNKCIEEIENFVVMLKRINEARKQLQAKKGKNKKKKVEDILVLQSQPPPEHRVLDIYQKFKHALNLLGKLQPHISDPSAPELIHYLFIPLGIIVKVTGLDKARSVVEPLLTNTCVDLLMHCLDSKEYHFWNSLGPNWTLTKTADQFKSRYFQVYVPIFADGWVPPEVVPDEKHEAAAKSVARMYEHRTSAEIVNSNPAVIKAAMKFKENIEPNYKQEDEKSLRRSNSSNGILQVNTAGIQQSLPQRNNSFNKEHSKQLLVGLVIYDYLAHNNKELTIQAGEKVLILENSRRWWLVKNSHGERGFVPSTVLEIIETDIDSSLENDATSQLVMEGNQNYMNEDDIFTTTTNEHRSQSPYNSRYTPSPPIIHSSIKNSTPPPQLVNHVTKSANTSSQFVNHHATKSGTPSPQFVNYPVTKKVTPPPQLLNQHGKNVTPPPQLLNQHGKIVTQPQLVNHHVVKNMVTPTPQLVNHSPVPYTYITDKNNTPPPTQHLNKSNQVVTSARLPAEKEVNENGYNRGTYLAGVNLSQRLVDAGEEIVKIPSTEIVLKREESYPLMKEESFEGAFDSAAVEDDGRVATAVLFKVTPPVVQPKRTSPNTPSYTPPILTVPPPPTPPPTPPLPPPPPPHVLQPVMLQKPKTSKPRQVSLTPQANQPDFQSELLKRLSLQSSSPIHLSNSVTYNNNNDNNNNIDNVDVFIPLYNSSTADDVSRWLNKLGFSQNTIDSLKGKTAHELFMMTQEMLLESIGNSEGKQLYNELLVQNGAKKKHDTMTEFQKALVNRVQRRKSADDKIEKSTEVKAFEEQSSVIKRQKEELEKLKQGEETREPGSATFTSFQSESDTTLLQNVDGNPS